MNNPFSKSEIKRKLSEKRARLGVLESEKSTLQDEYRRLSDAYDGLQSLCEEFYSLYPCVEQVFSDTIGDDSVWKGCTKNEFDYYIPEVYHNGLGILGADIVDARDRVGIAMDSKDREIDSVNGSIGWLYMDINYLEMELRILGG